MGEQIANEESFDLFKQCAVEVLQVEPSKIVPEARFADDLDADSLDIRGARHGPRGALRHRRARI